MHWMLIFAGRRRHASRRGTTGIAFALMLSCCMTFIGAAIDLKRATDYRAMLQTAADLAVLAAASTYTTGGSAAAVAYATAQTFYGRAANTIGLTSDLANNPAALANYSVTTSQGTLSNGQSAYEVTLTGTVIIKTTFMYPLMPTMTITVTATAANPIVTPVFSAVSFNSSAGDDNSVYAYPVPLDTAGHPEYTTFPSQSTFYEIGRNNLNFPVPAGQTFAAISATAPFAFALANITGGVGGYGPNSANCNNTWMNQYGVLSGPGGKSGTSGSGQTNYMFSTYLILGEPPTEITNYSYSWTGEVKSGSSCSGPTTIHTTTTYPTTSNCVFQAALYVPGVTTYTNPPQNGTCFSPAATPGLQFAAPTCQTLGGNTYAFWWNDMGGKIDDLDYNDAYFTVSCTGATSNGVAPVTQIVLVK